MGNAEIKLEFEIAEMLLKHWTHVEINITLKCSCTPDKFYKHFFLWWFILNWFFIMHVKIGPMVTEW